MAVSSPPPPRFHLSLHLQDPTWNPSPGGKRTRPAPTTETLRRRFLRQGVSPTPKILHTLRKKEALKALRRARKDTAAAAASAAASLNPCDEEIGAEDEEETRFRAAAAEYRALVFCCSTTLALLGSDPHLSAALARPAPPTRCRSMCYGMQCVPSQFPHSISLCTCVWFTVL